MVMIVGCSLEYEWGDVLIRASEWILFELKAALSVKKYISLLEIVVLKGVMAASPVTLNLH